ncbi:glycerophosphodiester phosphodiesterase [Rhizobacter sp. Root1221]|uniref:glycerophosphodiester phosphodiesterase n=1 Tax=Rhizobacter sp. Root1221 TaxID=1736433 RepID=UPI0006FEE98D|nr:glycerophosphodiester phosphodiesterase [Rhizobacter sp. Root1221]KQV90155.1 glycerophosphodiester phosphodiesterase [Rhizobacter sp. Root1221]
MRSFLFGLAVACAAAVAAPAAMAHDHRSRTESPLVIGHRGASGYLPEHTLESYALAIELGADYIEPDVVATRDGHLIARHEPNITNTTDVASHPEFASRRRTAVVDGATEEGFFASDFTLAEIRTLRAKQAFADRPQQFNGQFGIATLDEVIALAKRKGREANRTVGVYIETKHPTYHQKLGLPLEQRVLNALTRAGWNYREAPVFIQSFEQANLKQLNKLTRVKLVQLIDANDVNADGSLDFTAPYDRPYDWTASGDPALLARTFAYLTTDAGLREVRTYADGIGPWKRYIVSTAANPNGTGPGEAKLKLLPPTDLIARAHQAGLVVHAYTFRNEQSRLPADYAGNPVNEYLQYFALGIDGLFSDFADTAVAARVLHKLKTDPKFGDCFTGEARSWQCD